MLNITNFSSAAQAVKLDIEDTIAKILEVRAWLQDFDYTLNQIRANRGQDMTIAEVNSFESRLMLKAPYNYQDSDSTTGKTIVIATPINVRRLIEHDSEYAEFHQQIWISTAGDSISIDVQCFHSEGTGGQSILGAQLFVDGQYVEDIDDFELADLHVGQESVCSIITQMNNSLQADDFIVDMTNAMRNPASFNNIISKWATNPNQSSDMRASIDSAIRSIDGSPESILSWLKGLYSDMQNTTGDEYSLTFSSTDFMVRAGFASVANVVLSAIPAAVTAIAFTISKVAGAIAIAASAVFQAVSTAWNSASNPMIALKPNANTYYDYLPVPVGQKSIPSTDTLGFNVSSRRNMTLQTPLCVFRIFKNDGLAQTTPTNWEAFLKVSLDGGESMYMFDADSHSDRVLPDSHEWAQYSGATGLNDILDRCNISTSRMNSLSLTDMGNERTQATRLALNLMVFFICFCSHVWCDESEALGHFSSAWDDMKANPNATTVSRVFSLYRRILIQFYHDTDSAEWDRYWYDPSYTPPTGPSYRVANWTWNDIFNVLIPAVRRCFDVDPYFPGTTMCFQTLRGDSCDYIEANNNLQLNSASGNSFCMYTEDTIEQGYSCFAIPKYTSAGLLRNLIITAVGIAATVAIAVVAITKYKSWSRIREISKVNDLNRSKAVNDAIQNNAFIPNDRKIIASKQYIKEVRHYNRWSWLWGGGTYNAVNGWVDYAESSGSTIKAADLTSSLPSSTDMHYSESASTPIQTNVLQAVNTAESVGEIVDNIRTLIHG